MTASGGTFSAGEVTFFPASVTRPSVISFSASRREHTPARAITLAMRSPSCFSPPPVALMGVRGTVRADQLQARP
jgi:hypothetical protein